MSHHNYNLRSKKHDLRGAEIIPVEVRDAQILARLPAKDLMRYKSVSKSWSSLTQNPDFVRAYRKFNKKTNLLFFVWQPNLSRQHLFFVPISTFGISFGTPATSIFCREMSPGSFSFTTHMRVSNGLILIHNAYASGYSHDREDIHVVNPCSRELFNLPHAYDTTIARMYHFGFTTSGNEEYYKVLQVEETRDKKCEYKIFTLGSEPRSWRRIESSNGIAALPFDANSRGFADYSSSVCLDGVIYWTQRTTTKLVPNGTYSLTRNMRCETAEAVIVAFDVEDETFTLVPPPKLCCCNNAVVFNKIVEVRGCVALLNVTEDRWNSIDLWILKDSRNHRWVKETLPIPLSVMRLGECPFTPLYKILIAAGRFALWIRSDGSINCFDMERKTLQIDDIIWPDWLCNTTHDIRLVDFYDDTIISFG